MAAPRNQLLVGDARDCLKDLPDECVPLTITSPPYNLGKEYGEDAPDQRSVDEWRKLMSEVVEELFRVTTPDGKVCLNVAASFSSADDSRYQRVPLRGHLIDLCRTAGFDFLDEIVWVKHQYATHGEGALLGSYPYPTNIPINQRHEYILVFRKFVSEEYRAQRDTPSGDDERRSVSRLTSEEWREYAQSIWELPRASPDVDTDHPAVFPLELPRRLVALYSFAGDLVLDPFVGTGTTAVAAFRSGRDYLGFDIVESFVETARQRLGSGEGQPPPPTDQEPATPDDVAQYICDALDRQDPMTLRRIREYADALASHRESVPSDEISASDDETVTDVIRTHRGTIVLKEVSCGKENCSACPHGPYKYHVYRDGDDYTTEYIGPVTSDPNS